MSDEFLKIATSEINEEISKIQKILGSCSKNSDVYTNAVNIQNSIHKIKGLAPMMGKEELGHLSSLLESVLKKIIDGAVCDEILASLIITIPEMKKSMIYADYSLDKIKQIILQISSALS